MKYYFYKSGTSNCFLPYLSGYNPGSISEKNQGKSLPGLYVGFDDVEKKEVDENALANHIPIHVRIAKGGDAEFTPARKAGVRDDDHIAHIFHKKNRSQVRLIAFDKRHLLIMRIPAKSDSLIIFREGSSEFDEFKRILNGLSEVKQHYKGYDKANAVKFLEVEIEKVLPRDRLYLSLDSLSVFQYLNRGTCRPISIIGKTDLDGYKDLENILDQNIKENETPYGAFMRLYLDYLCGRECDVLERTLSHREYSAALVLATLNPILFETLAFYLCLDLGFIPEAANGKGLDVIDVRARFKRDRNVDSAVASLKKLGVILHSGLEESIRKNFALSIQCKAYSGDNAGGNDFLMFRRGESKARGFNQLFAADLKKILGPGSGFQHVNEFITSQVQALQRRL